MSTLTALTAYALKLILASQDPYATWKDTYPSTAEAFASESLARPLFNGADGEERTVAVYVGVSDFESHHNPKAKGDGHCEEWAPGTTEKEKELENHSPKCLKKGPPHSFCLGQVNDTNFDWLGVTKETLIDDVHVCVRAMGRMFAKSFEKGRECGLPLVDRLSWYVAGSSAKCDPMIKGRHRMLRATFLFDHAQK